MNNVKRHQLFDIQEGFVKTTLQVFSALRDLFAFNKKHKRKKKKQKRKKRDEEEIFSFFSFQTFNIHTTPSCFYLSIFTFVSLYRWMRYEWKLSIFSPSLPFPSLTFHLLLHFSPLFYYVRVKDEKKKEEEEKIYRLIFIILL